MDAQVRLLRAVQFKEIERVGGTRTVNTDVRIIAATHRNLEDLTVAGRFREDLYYRLNVFPITIQPLRERKEDIPALARYFMEKKSRELNVYPEPRLSRHAVAQLMNYNWPGNVRELSNIIERSLILNRNTPISFDHLKTTRLPAKPPDSQKPFQDDRFQFIKWHFSHLPALYRQAHRKYSPPQPCRPASPVGLLQ